MVYQVIVIRVVNEIQRFRQNFSLLTLKVVGFVL